MLVSAFLENLGSYSKSRNPQFRVLELLHGTTAIMQESEKRQVWQAQQVDFLCHMNRNG